MRLRGHDGGIYEEALYNLHYGLEDYHWARRFARRLGRSERERFSEQGWAYGDPAYFYGGDVMEVFAHQANVVVKTLFGDGLRCTLLAHTSDDEELYHLRASLLDEHALPAFGTPEEQLAREGDVPYGDSSTLFAEISGDAHGVWRLGGALRETAPKLSIFHYDPASDYGADTDRSEHLLLAFDCEYYPEREIVHYELFEALLEAWEAMERPTSEGR